MNASAVRLVFFILLIATTASATSFIIPTDEEMVAKSSAIVIATVEGASTSETQRETETIYEVRVERAIKGAVKPDELLRIASLGGAVGDHGVVVVGAARFQQGEHVLVFLTMSNGGWTLTDLSLGKFRFATSTSGEKLLVRDVEDVVGWDQAGNVHHETVRREQGFLRFIEGEVTGDRQRGEDYEVDASAATLKIESNAANAPAAAPFPAQTYTSWVGGVPTRWANMSAGIQFWKRSDQNIAGVSDGGVSVIQSGLAAWNNECGSLINLTYAGQRATASANYDGISVVEFNDPQQRISGSWTGSGTIAITFISYSGQHSFNGTTWYSIMDSDVVFQDGFPGTHPAFPTAMTHELGHAIGWRHSNQDYNTGGACNSSIEECTSAAIMNSSVVSTYGYTLQPWDVHAAQSVYPGGTCGVASGVHGDANGDSVVNGADVVYLVNYLFAKGPAPVGSADVNADGRVNTTDLFYLVNYVFADGPAPL